MLIPHILFPFSLWALLLCSITCQLLLFCYVFPTPSTPFSTPCNFVTTMTGLKRSGQWSNNNKIDINRTKTGDRVGL